MPSRVFTVNYSLINTITVGTIIEQTDNREGKHEAPTSEDMSNHNKRPRVDYDETTEISEEPQRWADMHQFDERDEEFIQSENERLGKCVLLRYCL